MEKSFKSRIFLLFLNKMESSALTVPLCVTCSLLSHVAWSADSIGTLGSVLGKAQIDRIGKIIPAAKGMEIFATDRLITSEKAAVKIQFRDGGNIIAFENSNLKIEEYKVQLSGNSTTIKSAIDIAKGKVRFFVKPNPNGVSDVKFKTANAIMGIRGTSGAIAVEGGKTTAGLFTGSAEMSTPGGAKAMLAPNQQISASAGDRSLKVEPLSQSMTNMNAAAKTVDPGSGNDEKAGSKDDKKSDDKKSDDKKSDDKKSDDKKSDDKKSTDKKSDSVKKDDQKSKDDGAKPAPISASRGGDSDGAGSSKVEQPSVLGSDNAPEPSKIERKNVFSPDGSQGVIVKDDKLSAISSNSGGGFAAKTDVSKTASSGSGAEAAPIPQTQVLSVPTVNTDILKQIPEVQNTQSNNKVIENQVTEAVKQAEIPQKKTVKIRIDIPPVPQ